MKRCVKILFVVLAILNLVLVVQAEKSSNEVADGGSCTAINKSNTTLCAEEDSRG